MSVDTGMLFAPETEISYCGPVYDDGGNRCSAGVLFTSMRTIVNGISGGSLVTG